MSLHRTLDELSGTVRTSIGSLYKWSEALALLDMLVSFATTASSRNYGNANDQLLFLIIIIIKQCAPSLVKPCAFVKLAIRSKKSSSPTTLSPMTRFATSAATFRSSPVPTW